MEDFDRIIIKDVVIEIVNLTRATFKEALIFKDRLNFDLLKFKKVVIDIRQCEFIDSSFLGAIVYTKKHIAEKGGDLRIVKSHSNVRTIMEKVGAYKFFSIFDTIESAVQSFGSRENVSNDKDHEQGFKKVIGKRIKSLLED